MKALLALALLLTAGCATVTPIGHLMSDPAQFDGRSVQIEGEVIGGAGALGVGAYQVRDATGTLTVISERGGAPAAGAWVRVRGLFEALVTFGSRGIAVLRERDRSLRQR